ncbi:hypothetical protein VNO77_00020 [Canavalia gladiata]|uniref:Uncharacterized protein n=1 Tax=Canavalia gladiata TaxID=3824 RepID=A0AAN9R4W8_CANGL
MVFVSIIISLILRARPRIIICPTYLLSVLRARNFRAHVLSFLVSLIGMAAPEYWQHAGWFHQNHVSGVSSFLRLRHACFNWIRGYEWLKKHKTGVYKDGGVIYVYGYYVNNNLRKEEIKRYGCTKLTRKDKLQERKEKRRRREGDGGRNRKSDSDE